MNVQVEILFPSVGPEEWAAMTSLANAFTNDDASVSVSVGESPQWLVAEFTMPTQSQSIAVDRIYQSTHMETMRREDLAICFPKSDAHRARVKRKTESRRSKRQQARETDTE